MKKDNFGYGVSDYQRELKSLPYGEGDFGYSVLALNIAKKHNIISEKMSPAEIEKAMIDNDVDPYNFIINNEILDIVFNKKR
tara:strand:- start:45 stop:290 length:246 start_codon:yes stop_codon:yes gene_type:complete